MWNLNNARAHLVIFNAITMAIYIMTCIQLKITPSAAIMYATPDAQEYRSASNVFVHFAWSGFSCRRPFLFPLLIHFTTWAGGEAGLWFFQFLLWLISINLVFCSVYDFTKRYSLSWIAGAGMTLNVSLIALTFHALTETAAVFLVASLVYLIVVKRAHFGSLVFFHAVQFIFILLTLIKPLFLIPGLLFFFFGVFMNRKKYAAAPWKAGLLFFILAPLLFQVLVMKMQYGFWGVSRIGSITLRHYLVAQGIQEKKNTSREASIMRSDLPENKNAVALLLNDKALYSRLFFSNVRENIKGNPVFLEFPQQVYNARLSAAMKVYNRLSFYCHCFFPALVFFSCYRAKRQRARESVRIYLALALLTGYIILSTGISSWQGDRLVLPALPAWLVLYSLVFHFCRDYLSDKMLSKKATPGS